MSNSAISFVLHRPARGGNVGAAARALTTMGFRDLRISAAAQYDPEEARAWAHGSTGVLDAARHYASLPAALEDSDLIVGTSARRRGDRREYLTPGELCDHLSRILDAGGASRICVVFGPEDHGLTNEDLDLCQLVSEIPMRRSYPSLNLAQAVMVYAYELAPLSFRVDRPRARDPRTESVRTLHDKVESLLPQLGFDPGRAVTRRIVERVGRAGALDVNLIHSVVNAVEKRLHQEKRPDGTPE